VFKLAFGEPCPCGDCDNKHHRLIIGKFKINYFVETSTDDWFLYIYWGHRWWRWSSAGFVKWRT
jgi:hypothetical protein